MSDSLMKSFPVRSGRSSKLSALVPLVTTAIVIAALYFGQEVLIPLALGLLLTFLLTPPVSWLERIRLGRAPAVFVVLMLAFAGICEVLWLGTTELADIVTKLPHYQENIRRKVEAMRNPAGFGMAKAADSIKQISAELTQNTAVAETRTVLPEPTRKRDKHKPQLAPASAPVTVEVVKHSPDIFESFGSIGNSLAHILGVAAAVFIFTMFMLVKRDDLRNRFFQLIGTGHLNVVTTALDDAAKRVSKYLLTQSVVNGTFGLLLGIGLYWIGVPNAAFWGLLGAVLRFIPYVGTLTAGLCPVLLALAIFDGWAKPMLAFGLFVGIELAMSAIVEPWLYGAHTGVSSLAILVSAAFWTLLWGPIGLVLSTPLTVCLLVLGRYVPQLKVLDVLLSDKAELPPEACYYQRLLAMDEDEAQEIAVAYLKDHSFDELCDSVLIPALSLAEQDRHENSLDEDRAEFIYRTTRDILEEIMDEAGASSLRDTSDRSESSRLSLLCIPARDEADELVGLMLAHCLRQAGYTIDAIPIGTVENMLQTIPQKQADIVFISALPPFAMSQSRALCRRARQRHPDLKIVVGLWGSVAQTEKIRERLGTGCLDNVVTTVKQAEYQVRLLASSIEAHSLEPVNS